MFVDSDDIDTVVLVVADSLRADTAVEWMPTLQALADDHIRCSSCYAPGPHTPSSMTGIVQSRLPVDGGYGTVLPRSPPTLAEALAETGVGCAGWHCNPHAIAERDFDRGFEVYADLVTDPPLHEPGTDDGPSATESVSSLRHRVKTAADTLGVRPGIDRLADILKRLGVLTVDPRVPATELVDAFQRWLSATDHERRFASLHLMDTHMPYDPPTAHWRRSDIERISGTRARQLYEKMQDDDRTLSDDELATLRRLYAAEAEYVDHELARLVDDLRSRGLWESTLLVVTADHGELFGDRQGPGGDRTGHPSYLCDALVHVPLVLAGGAVPSVSYDGLVSGLDLAPTVAAALDTTPPDEWAGQPVGATDRDEVVSTVAGAPDEGSAQIHPDWLHVAVRTADSAVLWWENETPTEHYRRADGTEYRDDNPVPAEYEHALDTARAHELSFARDTERPAVSEQRLRDLGYL